MPALSASGRRTLNVVFAITQALVPALPALGYGITVGARDGFASPPEVPAGYAFSIWGVIFLLSLIYAVVQVLPSARTTWLYAQIGTPSWVLFALSTLWMMVAQFDGPTALLLVIILAMLAIALRLLLEVSAASARQEDVPGRQLLAVLFGLYAGWLSLAAFLNISTFLREQDLAPLGLANWQYAIAILLPAALLVAVMLGRSRGQSWYLIAAVWGLAGVVVANMDAALPQAYVAVAAASLAVLLSAIALFSRREA